LVLDLLLVLLQRIVEFLVFRVLLDGADGSNGRSLRPNLVLEAHGQQVPLLSREVLVFSLHHLLQVVHHIVETLGLLGYSSHENVFFQ